MVAGGAGRQSGMGVWVRCVCVVGGRSRNTRGGSAPHQGQCGRCTCSTAAVHGPPTHARSGGRGWWQGEQSGAGVWVQGEEKVVVGGGTAGPGTRGWGGGATTRGAYVVGFLTTRQEETVPPH